MKISRKWLQTYFDAPLPNAEKLADAFTFHAFEVEEYEEDMLDLKVLPDRAGYALSHRGIAKELSAILDMPLSHDPLRGALPETMGLVNPYLKVEVENPKKCLRYMGALVLGVKVGPSPAWLKEALEAVEQRSINNIVDATNYVMLDIGQPLHAFDAAKLAQEDGAYAIGVRSAKEGEKITTLSGDEYTLTQAVQIITDAQADVPIALAGVKGGKAAEISEGTVGIIVESANFDGTTTRRAAQRLKLFTDASLRFQNRPSPELCGYAMRDVLALIQKVAGGEVVGVTDTYPACLERSREVKTTLSRINGLLGSQFSSGEVADVFARLGFETKTEGEAFIVAPPFERTDIVIPEDLAEEVGRIIGYDKISPQELPAVSTPPDQARFRGIEKVKDELVAEGFTEVSTQSFAPRGDIMLANPLDQKKPALRTNLKESMEEAIERAIYVAPLVLAPNQKPKLFEIGTIFTKNGETLAVETSEAGKRMSAINDDNTYQLKRYELSAFKPFSQYPFITRDIALWTPAGTDAGHIMSDIQEQAGELLVRIDLFDRFEREERTSLAFRLVFQSMERTLTDDEVNGVMEKVSSALSAKGYEVR